jgi:hypothetical protein
MSRRTIVARNAADSNGGPPLRRRVPLGGATLAASLLFLSVSSATAEEAPRYDEFGRVPADATDPDLTLPDPVLDRTWKGPTPGDPASAPKALPGDDAPDPFAEEEPSRPAKPPPRVEKAYDVPPPRPSAMPDGRPDPGDVPYTDTEEYDSPLGEAPDPSPLEQEEMHFEHEMSDPGE